MDFVAVAAGQAAVGGGFAGPALSFHVDLVDVQVAAAEAGCLFPSRGGEGLHVVALETEDIILSVGAGPPAVRVGSKQEGTPPRPMRVVALETFPFHAGGVTVLAGILFPVMAFKTEIFDPCAVQPSVEAVTGIASAIGQRSMAPREEESCQARAVRVMTGEAGSAVTADAAVQAQETLFVRVVTPSAQRVAPFHEHEPFLVAVIEVACAAVPVGEGSMNAPVPVAEGPQLMTIVTGFGRFRKRGGGAKKRRQEKQDAECSHVSIRLSFLKGKGKRSGKRIYFYHMSVPETTSPLGNTEIDKRERRELEFRFHGDGSSHNKEVER